VGGWFIGTALTAAAAAALWFIGLVPERNPVKNPPPRQQPGQQQPVAEAPSMDRARSRIMEGDYTKALDTFGQLESSEGTKPEFQAARGEAKWLAALEQLAKENKPINGQSLAQQDNVAKAKEDLKNAADAGNAEALFWLGQIQEMTGDKEAKATFQKGLAAPNATPAQKRRFQAALDRLELSEAEKPAGAGARLMPSTGPEAYWLALATLVLQVPPAGAGQPPPPAGGGQPPQPPVPGAGQPPQPGGSGDEADTEEAGFYFWDAVKLAQNNKYAQAIQALDKARQVHDQRRFTRLRKSQNPLSDPTEQIFLRACDELKAFWQVRDDLGKAGYLDVNKPATPNDVVQAMSKIGNDKGGMAELAKKLGNAKDPLKAVDQLLDDKKKAEDDKQKADKQVADVVAAAKAAGVKDDDPVKAVAELDAAKKAADKKAADVQAALKDAGINAADPVKGVADLDAARKAAEKKVADVLGALKAGGINEADPTRGVQQLAAARDAAHGSLDALLKKLVDRKYLPPTATRMDVGKGLDGVLGDVDHPVVVALSHLAGDLGGMGGKCGTDLAQAIDVRQRLVAAELDVGRLNAELADRWTPRQMLDVWVTVLRDPANKEFAARALKDVHRISTEKPGPEAECVRGLAARSQGRFDEARTALQKSVKAGAGPWEKVAAGALAQLTDPSAVYVPTAESLEADQHWPQALSVVEEALQVFPKDGFPSANAALLALRSVVRLDMASNRSGGKIPGEILQESQQDAAAAVAGGETIEGPYAQGRLAEARGDLAKAEAAYRTALKAYAEAAPADDKSAAAYRKAHPVSDPAGSRYRVALSRVLLAEVEAGREPAPVKEEKPKAGGAKTTERDARSETVANAGEVILASPPVFFACWCGCMPPYGMPVVLLEQPAGAMELGGEPPDPRLLEVVEQGEKLIAAGDYRGYLIKGEALGRMHQWGDAVKATVAGVARELPPEAAVHFAWVMDHHPCFQRRDGIRPPDPLLAEEHFAAGLRYYFDRRYADAEKELSDAVYFNDQDARYNYFLGLARLAQPGKRDLALEDFRQAARLELVGRPPHAAVSISLERIQGPTRRLLNEVRAKAIEEATSRPDVPPRMP
jgi:tetratricopeptide (TPR) repeat protein